MIYLIFIGDMLVMAFMIALVVWVSVRTNSARLASAARIPLEDETRG
jgi:cbb3-type cytochrome oxidase subunit 3